jgi:fucose permease
LEEHIEISSDRFADYLKEVPNFLSVFIFSVFYNIASLMLLDMSKTTGIKTADLSLIFTFFTIGAVAGQLTSVLYTRKFSKIQVIISGYIITVPLIIVEAFNSNIIVFYILYLICGYTLGVVWIQANDLILTSTIKSKERLVTVLLTFYPIGALVSPFISSSIIKAGLTWRFSYYVIVFLIVVNIGLYIFLMGRRKGTRAGLKDEKVALKSLFVDRKKNLVLFFVFFAMIFYCVSETIIATWAPTFFRSERGLYIQSAGFLITIFWIFIVIGRVISMSLAGRVKPVKVMAAISIIAIVSVSIVIFIKSVFLIYILVALAGIGYSALFPLLISTGSTVYERGRGILATILFVASNIGLSAAPFLTKYISSKNMLFSLGVAPVAMAVVFSLVIAVMIIQSKKNCKSG